jgi:diguanylate cyclase (GGDEF)-like protein
MHVAPIPADEEQRLKALQALGVLDTDPEERFDRLTRMAKRLFGVKMVLISLVDAKRQWFKSRQGLDAYETPRDVSFCGHAVLSDELMQVPDAWLDPRFVDNPLVIGAPHVRFYAGQPLHAPDGSRVGTLCLIDIAPRELSSEERELLKDLAITVEHELAMVQLAMLDELTGLSNRRGFVLQLEQTLALCRRLERSALLLYFDLDRFKQINDLHGHSEGDRVLRDFAELLRQTTRGSDVLGRLGGDEFVALLPGADTTDRDHVLQRLDQALADYNADAQRDWLLGYSVGWALAPEGRAASAAELMAAADQQMYLQKRQHRSEARP